LHTASVSGPDRNLHNSSQRCAIEIWQSGEQKESEGISLSQLSQFPENVTTCDDLAAEIVTPETRMAPEFVTR